jgi:23S rRNA pseudouridine1911/1915/1917 synthase
VPLDSRNPAYPACRLLVDAAHERQRLDQFVAAALAPELSRSQLSRMIRAGLVTVNGTGVRAAFVVRPGDQIEIVPPPSVTKLSEAQNAALSRPSDGAIEIVFSDEELLVVSKPAGIPVHPSPGHPDATLADFLIARFQDLAAIGEPDGIVRAGIVHRLDKETSGVMAVARTPFARTALSNQFKERSVSKVYLAIVRGIVSHDRFTVARPLGRHPTERKRMSVHSRRPREARTDFVVIHRFGSGSNSTTLVKAMPQTGRTHQIRVHLATSGYPCVGDPLYGSGKSAAGWSRAGQALHALALTLTHPRTGQRLEFAASPPNDMVEFLKAGGLVAGASTIRQWIDAR